MPPRTALSTPLRAWRCPQCTSRALSTTSRLQQVGPESPRYIQVPEPPQQTIPYRPWVKGILPVPRDVFARKHGKDVSSDRVIAQSSPSPQKASRAEAGSREEWKAKISAQRRQNLREGVKELRLRQQRDTRVRAARSEQRQREREELLQRAEREDERLTTASHNLDLEALFKGPLQDPTREARLAAKRSRLHAAQTEKQETRISTLHTLYTNARHFIVTPQQLDAAVNEAFGTDDNPVTFGHDGLGGEGSQSIWANGRPEKVQDMLNKATRKGNMLAMEAAGGQGQLSKERMRRVAEVLTGGKMEGEEGAQS